MTRQKPPQIFIYAALPCEAKPLIEHFKLKKNTTVQPFAVYFSQDICLTVTGLGKSAMAAGLAYTQALFASVEHPVLVNIGIAGHIDHALGRLFLIDKITDVDSRKSYYPPLVFTPPCPTACIQTVSRPQLGYDSQHLCDMEASAFYETAVRFSSGELIHCLKVISDNEASPAENIQPKQVAALIGAHVSTIETLLAELSRLAKIITVPEPKLFEQLTQRYHFTVSEQGQLKNQLSRWVTLTDNQALEFDETRFRKGKDLLFWLDQQISKVEFCL
ncbi:phosphorylase family protein [Methylobacter sp.]|uniref:phosphorylase family protein n=1 Tax=Methylobacter sp. TaxID=2051955 RepID=UPI002FDDA86F